MDANSRLLRRAFDAAVAAAHPRAWLAPHLAHLTPPEGAVRVIALGKAAVPMAETFAGAWQGQWTGLAITPAGTARPIEGFQVVEGSHPVPDARSVAAGEAALAFAGEAGPEDLLLILISGGASALACAPIQGLELEDKVEITRRMLASGAGIGEINTVRRALSRLKGGGLARASRAGRALTLAMSDVPGDRLADIGSGPGIASPTKARDALEVLSRFAPDLIEVVERPMRDFAARATLAGPRTEGVVLLPIDAAVREAEAFLRREGLAVVNLGVLDGDVDAAVERHLAVLSPGRIVVSGGELGVAVPREATGQGGRNQHFILALASRIAGRDDVWALAADTDGIDGDSPAAGGWIDPAFLRGLDASIAITALSQADSHGLLATAGRLIETGPTGVNVGDLRLVYAA